MSGFEAARNARRAETGVQSLFRTGGRLFMALLAFLLICALLASLCMQ
jgi:hypothetical protein